MKTETKRELFHKVPHRDTGDGCAGCRPQSLLAGGCSQVTVLAKRLQVWTQDALGSARGEEGAAARPASLLGGSVLLVQETFTLYFGTWLLQKMKGGLAVIVFMEQRLQH